jgi:hypothetical protein
MSKSKRQLQAKAESDVSETVKNADGEPENPYNRVLQDIAEIFPFYPFRQGQTDARYEITVHRRDKDEYKRLFLKFLKNPLTKKEHKALKQLDYELYWRKNRLTIEELRLIGQTVGSYDMDTIRDFLLRHCYVPQSELNDLSWEDILKRLKVLQFSLRRGKELQADPASTKQNGKKTKSKGRGRPKKYNEKILRRVYATFEQKYQGTRHKQQAWQETAEEHNLKSGKAAEIACRRYLKKQNKKQN